MVEKVRVAIATGEASKECWYLLTSLPPHQCSPGEMLRLFRSHWSIENNLHHVKDRSWDEDRHTLRRPGLGEVFATLVNVSLNTLCLACVWKDGFLPECPCRCEPRPVPSARNRLSPGSSDTQPDFAIVLSRTRWPVDAALTTQTIIVARPISAAVTGTLRPGTAQVLPCVEDTAWQRTWTTSNSGSSYLPTT